MYGNKIGAMKYRTGIGSRAPPWRIRSAAYSEITRRYAMSSWGDGCASTRTGRLDPVMTGSFAGPTGTFFGYDQHEARPVRVRFVWEALAPGHARWTQAFAPGDSRDWEGNWVMTFSRTATIAHAATTSVDRYAPRG